MARTNSTSNGIVAVLIALAIVGVAVWWFFDNFEKYEKERYVGYSGEAARNPYFAAELYLKKFNTNIEAIPTILDLNKMPDTNDILFIPTKRFDIGEDRLNEIMQWVKEGGHLIALARYPTKKDEFVDDLLFQELNITSHRDFDVNDVLEPLWPLLEDELDKDTKDKKEQPAENKTKSKDEKKAEVAKDAFDKGMKSILKINREPLTVKGSDKIEDKKVVFLQTRWMEYEDSDELVWVVEGKNGAQVLEYRIGDGRITLLSDIRFMRNPFIGKHDHASFLHMLIHVDGSLRKLWFIKHGDSPSLISILFDKAAPAMYSFLVFLFIWIWYASRRLGPVMPDATAVRRSMREHIESTGHYQWRSKNRNQLLASVHKALNEQIAQTRPLWAQLSNDELSEKLANLSGIEKQRVFKAITTKNIERELEFTALIETLSLLRKKL